MTLTTLSSKELKPLYNWALRRNKVIIIIYSAFLLLNGPLLDMFVMSIGRFFDSDFEEVGAVSLGIYMAVAAFFTFVSALKTFSFLHNKRSVDMFGSLPTNRTTMYAAHLLGGITAVTVPYLIMSLLVIGMTARSGEMLKLSLFMIGTTLLMIIASYIFTSLIAYCCGTIVDTAIVTIGANAIWVGIIGLYYGFITEMIPGIDFEAIIDTPLLSMFAPYGFSAASLVYYMEEQTGSLVTLLVWQFIYIAGALFLALLAANKRKAETSQNGFSVKWLPMVIKAGASVVCGGLIGFIAAEVADSGYNNMFVFCFWYAVIGFVAFSVLHLIFARGLKGKIAPSLITYASTTAAAIAVLFMFSFGMGIDTYVPSPATVKSVTFSYEEFKDPENIKTITEIHKLITEGIRNNEEYPYYIGNDDYYRNDEIYYEDSYITDDAEAWDSSGSGSILKDSDYSEIQRYYINQTNFDFNYKRKVGFGVTRNYYIYSYSNDKKYDYSKIYELLTKLYSSDEYKKIKNKELFDDEEADKIQSGSLTYFYYFNDNYLQSGEASLPINDAFMTEFREALRQDILNDTKYQPSRYFSSYGKEAYPFIGDTCIHASIRYLTDDDNSSQPYYEYNYYYDDYDDYDDYHYDYNNNTRTVTTIIKPYYENTLKVLRDYQIKPISSRNYQDYTYSYPDSYYEFCENGRPDTLRKLAEDSAFDFVSAACTTSGANINEWMDINYKTYKEDLLKKADELYKKYMLDTETHDQPKHSGDYYIDNYTYQTQADTILNDLLGYTFEYVELTSNGSAVF